VYRRDAGGDTLTLTVKGSSGEVVHTLKVAPGAGIHRVLWNLRGQVARGKPARPRRFQRARAVDPGPYTVTLEGSGQPQTVEAVVKPRVVLPRG